MSSAPSKWTITAPPLPTQQSAPERTGWRDQWLSEWHRRQHHSLAMVDLDFVCVEMRYSNPVALIDYKFGNVRQLDLTSAAFKGLNNLALAASLPFFVVFYSHDPVFAAQPINPLAHRELTNGLCVMSEREYVEWLFALRKETCHETYLRDLSTAKPPLAEAS